NRPGNDNTAFLYSVSITNISGSLTLPSRSAVTSRNTGANAITLRGDNLAIDTGSNPAVVGANPIVGGSPRATITGPGNPVYMTLAPQGNLSVVWSTVSSIVDVYAPGSTAPTSMLTGLNIAEAVAFDSQGNIYVSDSGDQVVYVFEPDPSSQTLEPAFALTG